MLLVQSADDFAIGALQHLDDLAFGSAAAVDAALARRGTVAVQHLVHFARAQEVVISSGIRNEKSESVRMALHRADDQIELGDDAQLALAVGEQLAVAFHRGQPSVEGFARDDAHAEFLLQVRRRQRRAGVLQRGEDGLARGQQRGIDVAGTGTGAAGRANAARTGARRARARRERARGALLARRGRRAGGGLAGWGEFF